MEKQPQSSSTDAIDRDTPRELPTSSDAAAGTSAIGAVDSVPLFETSEPSNGQSTKNTEHIEKTTSKDIPAAANPRQKLPTPIVELIRNMKDGFINARRCEVTDGTITATATSQDRNLPIALYKSLRLPTGFKKCDSGREMFDRIRTLIQHHAMLSERQSRLVAYWSMACM